MNFKAVEPTAEQLEYYGSWAADFVLTVNKAVTFNANSETADGYLGGQYDAWSNNWINVPTSDVTLEAGGSLKIMEYAGQLVEGYTGTTYKDVVNTVKDFDCGVYFTPAYLNANPDLQVSLSLIITNGTETKTIGTYAFSNEIPALPTATVKEIAVEDLTFAMNFVADAVTESQLAYYGDWAADFVLTLNKDVEFDGTTNYLAGQYDKHSAEWVKVPSNIVASAGKEIKIMQYLGSLMGSMEAVTYEYVVEGVKDFDCGVHFSDAFLAANDGLVAKLELRLYVPNSTEYYVIGDTYTFTVSSAKDENNNVGSITDLLEKADDAAEGGTVTVTADATTADVTVGEKVTLDLAGNTLEAKYVNGYGAITDSTNGQALLKVKKLTFAADSKQEQLPVYDTQAQGYRFFNVEKIRYALLSGSKYAFQPLFNEATKDLLLAGAERTGVTMLVTVEWNNNGVKGSAEFEYSDALVKEYLESYSNGSYGNMFTLTITNADELQNLTFKAVIRSSTGVDLDSKVAAAQ